MPRRKKSATPQPATERTRDDWLARLNLLIDSIERWAQELGWSTRRIEKRMQDSEIGPYDAPALLLQEETTKALLEPIARSTPGSEGVVDLYLMPAYDDIASIYFHDGQWRLHYVYPNAPVIDETDLEPLSKETLRSALHEMKAHAATAG